MIFGHFFIQQVAQNGGLYVGPRETLDKPSAAEFRKLGTGFQLDAFRKIEANIVIEGTTAFAFDDAVWQEAKIEAQTTLYAELGAHRFNSEIVRDFELSALKSRRLPAPDRLQPSVLIERHFLVERAGDKIEVVVSSDPNTQFRSVIEWREPVPKPLAVSQEPNPWVQYPARYDFQGFGKVYDDHDRYYAARKEAIILIDTHIDEFMAKRTKSIDAIAFAGDGLPVSLVIGKRVNEVEDDIALRLTEALGKCDPPRPPAWAAGARITSVQTKVFLIEKLPNGSSVAITLP